MTEDSGAPRAPEGSSGEERSDEPRDTGDPVDEVPLDIAGHGDRDPPEASADGGLLAADESDGGTGAAEPATTDDPGDGPETTDAPGDEPATRDAEAEVEPVEVLVGLAEDGEIDPWDIDIVAVTDKYLDRLDEADLRTSGRALFYASVLLRMKGDAMLEDDDEADEDPWDEPWEAELADEAATGEGEGVGADPFAALDEEIDRRLERKRARGMPQTLDELVRDLREAERETWWKESREYDTSDSPRGFRRGTQELDYRRDDGVRMDDEPTAKAVTGTTHTENVDEIVAAVHDALREQYDQGRAEVLYREIEGAGGSRVETFLGLLFLSHRGQVRLVQDELFGDLWIRDPAAETGSKEAVAD